MTDVGPIMITARSSQQAEYLVRSRAEQRGITVGSVDATGGTGGMWAVTLTVEGAADAALAARLGDDTQVVHFDTHRRPPPPA